MLERVCMQSLSHVSDDDLIEGLRALVGAHRRTTAEIVAHLAEMDARRLYAEKGYSSLFAYCVQELSFSEDEACRRIEAARLMRRFPVIHGLLERGTLSLTVLGLLKPHLTDENHEKLLAGVSGANVRRAKEWLARRFPQPDVASTIRKLPERNAPAPSTMISIQGHTSTQMRGSNRDADGSAAPVGDELPDDTNATDAPALGLHLPHDAKLAQSSESGSPPASTRITQGRAGAPPQQQRAVRIEPLSRDRFVVRLTADRSLKDKLELARDLMLHRNPSGDLAVVIERGLDLLIAEIEKTKFGQSARPQKKHRNSRRGHVGAATRREVTARDGIQCSFVAPDGQRCESRAFLEFDHMKPVGCGGGSETDNVRILCRAHNLLAARQVYGAAYVNDAASKARVLPP